ncbi:MAG: hypothetical protein V7K14_29555 [Nostoc sp.]|uniref:hypothetical protein n=1 Tax=Nostoc sp. TaxID=1180 RepID=UPI002FF66848
MLIRNGLGGGDAVMHTSTLTAAIISRIPCIPMILPVEVLFCIYRARYELSLNAGFTSVFVL